MSTHKRIYSPDNEPFDVAEPRRSQLILNEGWSQTPQETAPEPEAPAVTETARGSRRRPEPELASIPEIEEDPSGASEDEVEEF